MSKNAKQEQYSQYFNNRIDLPRPSLDRIIIEDRIIQKYQILDYQDGKEEQSINLYFHAAECFKITGKENSTYYPGGYLITDDWIGLLWHCDSFEHIPSIVADYTKYLKAALKQKWDYIKVQKWYTSDDQDYSR